MALVFTQTPPVLSTAQSPVVFSVLENTGLYSASEFQYNCDLRFWTGSESASGSVDYVLYKFPNQSGVGMFDVSRILNSALRQLAYQYSSSIAYYNASFSYTYLSGSGERASSSLALTSSVYKALDGYGIFPEPINQNVPSKSVHWPMMTDGPVTQSVLPTDIGSMSIYVGSTGAPTPTKVVYTKIGGASADIAVAGTTSSLQQVVRVPVAPSQASFPLTVTDGDSFSIQAYSGSTALNNPILYNVICAYKYTPIRIQWKNRYGQFDYLNFYKAHYINFGTEQKTYQPQLGSWDATALNYNQFQTNVQRYIVDTNERLDANTDFLPETYNEILKQMLVSDEIYWAYDQPNNLVKPLTIQTSNIRFKTGVNDKLIQYTISFTVGQTYKLII